MHPWLFWLIAAAGLAVAEAFSLDLILIMLAAAAAVGSVTAALSGPAAAQIALALGTAAGLLLFIRPVARSHLSSPAAHPTGIEALLGKQAVVLSTVDDEHGLIRLNGAQWSAKAFEPGQVMSVGTSVQVIEIRGATALVWDHGRNS
jgi:membrane protein implicated in regulation of membrane protease activity